MTDPSPPKQAGYLRTRLLLVGGLLGATLLGGWWLLAGRNHSGNQLSALDRLDPAQIPPRERFDWQPPELVAVFGSHRGRAWEELNCAAIDPQGRWLAGGGNAKVVRLWPVAHPERGTVLRGHQDGVNVVAFSPSGRVLASGSHDHTIRLWDLSGDRPRPGSVLRGHGDSVLTLAFAPDGKWLASGGLDGAVGLWHLQGNLPLDRATLYGHPGGVKAVAFAPDGQLLATAGGRNASTKRLKDHAVRLWTPDGRTFGPLRRLEGHTAWVTSLAFTPDGEELFSCSQDGTVRRWSVEGKKPKGRLIHRQKSWAMSVCVAPEGRAIAAAFLDGRVIVWDGAGRRKLYQWRFPGPVHHLVFAADGKHLLSANGNGTVYILRLALPAPFPQP
jgi:WD40 repeat protein